MKISTKTGDAGKTKLMFGRDVFKCDRVRSSRRLLGDARIGPVFRRRRSICLYKKHPAKAGVFND